MLSPDAYGYYGLEPVEFPISQWSETIDGGDPRTRAMAAIDLIVSCFSGIPELKNDKTAYTTGHMPKVVKGQLAVYPSLADRVANQRNDDDLSKVLDLVTSTKERHQGRLFRPELWADALKSTKGLAMERSEPSENRRGNGVTTFVTMARRIHVSRLVGLCSLRA